MRYENSLLAIDDLDRAAKLCERFAHRAWPRVLNAFARRLNPLMASITRAGFGGYYWVLDQAEIATDVMFKSRSELLAVWPDLVRHAALNMSAEGRSSCAVRRRRSSRPTSSPSPCSTAAGSTSSPSSNTPASACGSYSVTARSDNRWVMGCLVPSDHHGNGFP